MATSDVMKAAKTAQVRESIDRGGRSPDAAANREMNEAALDVAEDSNAPGDEIVDAPARQQQTDEDAAPPARERALSPFEQRRAAIIAGFRDQRAVDSEDSDDNTRDIRRLTRDGMPPELTPLETDQDEPVPQVAVADVADEPEVDAAQTPTDPPPAKVKIKVRGKELEVTQDELLAYAQKGAAGDDYLDEARKKLDEVNTLYRDTKSRATSAAQPGTHPAGHTSTETDVDASPGDTSGDEHHVDPFVKTAETVQLGTPEEAASELRKTVEDTATKAARDALERERLRDEVARSSRFLKDFQDANQDLAADSLAHAVIERKLYDLQVEDIKALGIDDAKLPKTPTDIANWHLWYRANGYKVRNIPELLGTARDEFKKWKGVEPKAKTDEPAPRKVEPRVEVTVDRSQRRAAIPQQPSRTVAPKSDARQAAAQPRDRSTVVQDMIAARAKPRGKVMGT